MHKEKTQGFSLKNFTATIIGIGGLGCNIACHLAGGGIGSLNIIDFDTVSISNLNRQFLYTSNDLSKPKAFIAQKKLSEYAEDTKISAFNQNICTQGFPKEAYSSDIIFSAVDNKIAREKIFEFSNANNIPCVFAGIDNFYGNTYLYIPKISPCPHCAGVCEGENITFSISAVAGIIGSLQSALGIKYLLTKDQSLAGVLTVYDSNDFYKLKIKFGNNCKYCNTKRSD